MRPVAIQFRDSQQFGDGATAGIVGNINASRDTMEYYVGLYGNYQPYGHAGLDIACPIGTPIYAPADGTVLYAGWCEDLPGTGNVRKWLLYYNFGGIVTVIQHDGWISVIAHQSDNNAVRVGQRVKEGQLIGKSGNTKTRGSSVAAHVHVEALVYMDYRTDVRKGIVYGRVNPQPFFGGIAAQGTTITQEDELSAEDVQKINDYTAKVLLTGYTVGGKAQPPLLDILVENQRRISVARDVAIENQRRITELRELVKQLSVKQGVNIDYAAIAKAVNDDQAKRMTE